MKRTALQLLVFLGVTLMSTFASAATKSTADNSARNKIDQSGTTLTPVDQAKGSEADVETTRRIREALTKDSELSTYAQNIKIITLNGKTVLRGPVTSLSEKAKVESIARTVAGNALENNLTISQ